MCIPTQGIAASTASAEPVTKKRRYQRPGLPKSETAATATTTAPSSAVDSGDIEQKADNASDQDDAPMIEDSDIITDTHPTTSIPTTYSASTTSAATKPSTSHATKTPAKPTPARRASTGTITTTAVSVYKSSVSTRSAGIKTRSACKPHLRG